MAMLNGKFYSKRDLLQRVGNMRQLSGVRPSLITMGKSGGIKILDVSSWQLHFTVMESRNLDILNMSYKGVPINFLSKPGAVNAGLADPVGMNFLRSISGGMLYTCGLSNAGAQYEDENGLDYFHGRQRFLPAENISLIERWEGDDYITGVSGEMRDNGLFRENIVLRRTITTKLGSKTISIEDEAENESFGTAPFMVMYHVNVGFPILQSGSEVFIPSKKITPMSEFSEKELKNWDTVTDPVDGMPESVFVHELKADCDGFSCAGVHNKALKMGVSIRFSTSALPYIVEWRSLGSSDYVLGIHPSNCHANGREYEIGKGTLQYIRSFEKKPLGFQLIILDGDDDYEQFVTRFKNCGL